MKNFPEINLDKYKADFAGYKYSISFVGNPAETDRLEILCNLTKIFKNKLHIFSSEKNFKYSFKKIKQENLLDEDDLATYLKCYKNIPQKEEELTQIYNASRINLNINPHKRTSANTQLFEILASGGFAITNEKGDLKTFFKISKQLETYNNLQDLIDKIDFYLKNLNIAQKIAQLGRFQIIKNQKASMKVRKV